jgi:hypothetical protein
MARDPFPLQWPEGWPRSKWPEASKFKVSSFAHVRDRVIRNLQLMRGDRIVITSNLPCRNDGLPYANASEPADHGIAVYWRQARNGEYSEQVIACDRWNRTRDNLHAIELSLEALRGLSRWGTSQIVERAVAGFKALPPTGQEWRAVFPGCHTLDEVKLRFRQLAADAHPDRGGGEVEMQRLNSAYSAAKAELGAP